MKDYFLGLCNYLNSLVSSDDAGQIWRNQEPNKRDLFLISTTGIVIGLGLGVGGWTGLTNGLEALSQKNSLDSLNTTFIASADILIGAAALGISASVVYYTKKFFSTSMNKISQSKASLAGRSISEISTKSQSPQVLLHKSPQRS